jgi:hypothetical protein
VYVLIAERMMLFSHYPANTSAFFNRDITLHVCSCRSFSLARRSSKSSAKATSAQEHDFLADSHKQSQNGHSQHYHIPEAHSAT